jgi:transcriptional regulator with XRE-family HTH domain
VYKWTALTVAGDLGISAVQVHRILNGIRYPSLRIMRVVARVYKWPLMEQIALIPDEGCNEEYGLEFRRRLGPQHDD